MVKYKISKENPWKISRFQIINKSDSESEISNKKHANNLDEEIMSTECEHLSEFELLGFIVM